MSSIEARATGPILVSLVVALSILVATSTEALSQTQTDVYTRIDRVARDLRDLGSLGIDVSGLSEELNRVLEVIDSCGVSNTSCLGSVEVSLAGLEREVEALRGSVPGYVLWRQFSLWARTAVILSIPVLFYIYFPRLYAWWWFRSRRGWAVRRYIERSGRE